jgi:hypothetical protein
MGDGDNFHQAFQTGRRDRLHVAFDGSGSDFAKAACSSPEATVLLRQKRKIARRFGDTGVTFDLFSVGAALTEAVWPLSREAASTARLSASSRVQQSLCRSPL